MVNVQCPDPGLDRAKYCIRIYRGEVREQSQAGIAKVLDFVQQTARCQPGRDDFTGNFVFMKISKALSERDQQTRCRQISEASLKCRPPK